MGFPHSPVGKEFSCNAGHLGSVPGLGRSSGEGKGYPLQYNTGKYWPGEFQGLYSPWGRKESDTTERLSLLSDSKGVEIDDTTLEAPKARS